MKRLVVLLALAALALGFAPAATSNPSAGPDVRFIVMVEPGAPPSPAALNAAGARDIEPLEYVERAIVVVAPAGRQAALERVNGVHAVARDFPVYASHHACGHDRPRPYEGDCDGDDPDGEDPESPDPDEPEGDDESTQQTPWGVAHIGSPTAWETARGQSVRVCVADTGIAQDHPDLRVVDGRNFTRGSANNWDDKNGHGTHVAGTVAALDSTIGVVGVAPAVELLAAKVLDNSGAGAWSWVLNGINWCHQAGADVINMSLGGTSSDSNIDALLDDVVVDLVAVAAAGNRGEGAALDYPARHAGVIAVGASDQSDAAATFSTRGEDVLAPGVSILSTVPGGYGTKSGTSMAAPHVAGVAALVLEHQPDLGSNRMRDTLVCTAVTTSDGSLRVDAVAAVAGCDAG